MKQFRYRLKQDEADIVNQYRAIKKEANDLGLNDKDVKHGWIKSKTASLFFKNPNFKSQEDENYAKVREGILDYISNHGVKYELFKREDLEDGHLLVIDPADVHIGKLCDAFETGEAYDNQIAVQRVLDGVQGILINPKDSTSTRYFSSVVTTSFTLTHRDEPLRQALLRIPTGCGTRIFNSKTIIC